ncbi:hypothetical protein [Dactylosporangium sp. CA-092794]|uniref:hypothetical protein n=1 Tax=Dactylosporangium sp. CA-092794 TaxID=3239929 RepID=UPI003D8CBF73
MTLKVSPAALNAYAWVLTDMAEAAEAMRRYAHEWSTFGFNEHGILGYAEYSHRRFADDVQDVIGHLGEVLATSAAEVRRAEEFYLSGDRAAAERLDGKPVRRASLADDQRPGSG